MQIDVDGRAVQAIALNDVKGNVQPDLVAGRAPRADDEIILGSRTLHEIGARVGDRIAVRVGDRAAPMRVVGRALFPEGGDATGHLDDGAQITYTALHALDPNSSETLVRFTLARDVDRAKALSEIRGQVAPLQFLPAQAPTTITSFGRTNNLPAIVATVMAAVATATLAHAMVTSVRRRQREFAILESIGLVRRQRSIIVLASAVTFACATAVIGIPIGVAAGRSAWKSIAHALGIPAHPITSPGQLALIVVGVFAITVLIAILPAAVTRHWRAAQVLRSE